VDQKKRKEGAPHHGDERGADLGRRRTKRKGESNPKKIVGKPPKRGGNARIKFSRREKESRTLKNREANAFLVRDATDCDFHRKGKGGETNITRSGTKKIRPELVNERHLTVRKEGPHEERKNRCVLGEGAIQSGEVSPTIGLMGEGRKVLFWRKEGGRWQV